MTDEWTRAEKRKAQSEQAKAIMNFVGMLSDKIADLEKENAELITELTKAKEFLKWFVWYFREGSPNLVPYKHKVKEAEQFLKEVEK